MEFPTPQLNIEFILTKKKKNSLNLPQWSSELLNSILEFIINSIKSLKLNGVFHSSIKFWVYF
jgi:hypothetical protein